MASSLGKMPTTSVRRLISPLSRSIGFVLNAELWGEAQVPAGGGRPSHLARDFLTYQPRAAVKE